jgi:hypothetical protein
MQPDDLGVDPRGQLGPLAERFDSVGLSDIARRLRRLAQAAGAEAAADSQPGGQLAGTPPEHLLSLAETVVLLGLRSRATVLGLIGQRLLEACTYDGQVFVSRESVAELLQSPLLEQQRRIEAQIWAALGGGDDAP